MSASNNFDGRFGFLINLDEGNGETTSFFVIISFLFRISVMRQSLVTRFVLDGCRDARQ